MTYSQTLANNILDTLKKTLTDKGSAIRLWQKPWASPSPPSNG